MLSVFFFFSRGTIAFNYTLFTEILFLSCSFFRKAAVAKFQFRLARAAIFPEQKYNARQLY